jgi:hypothetical protein
MVVPNVRIVFLPVGKYDRRSTAETYENAVFETEEEARKNIW